MNRLLHIAVVALHIALVVALAAAVVWVAVEAARGPAQINLLSKPAVKAAGKEGSKHD